MSLREEIKTIISKYTSFYPHPNTNDDFIVDDILSIFEKRIDLRYKKEREESSTSEDFDDGIYYFYQRVKEMLK